MTRIPEDGPDDLELQEHQAELDDAIEVVVTEPVAGENSVAGTVLVFKGESGPEEIRFAVDHRPAYALIDALEAGEHPIVLLEPWQIISRRLIDDGSVVGSV